MTTWTAKQAHEAWSAGQAAIVDVRETQEHDATSVPGVPLVPMSELLERIGDLPDGRPLVVMCRSGARSGQVADYLNEQDAGYEAINLEGGILAWAADGLPYEGVPPE